MKGEDKTKRQLINELSELRKRLAELEQLESAHKTAEEALRESEEKYERLVEDSLYGIAIVRGTEIGFVNRALLTMFGVAKKEEMVGRTFTDFVTPRYRKLMVERGFSRESGKSVIKGYEFKALRRDGTEFDAEISASGIAYKGSMARQGIIRDITERRQVEGMLRESEARYKAIVEHTMSGVAVYRAVNDGEDFVFIDFNKSSERIDRIKRDAVIGRSVLEVFPSVREFGLLDVMKRVWASGKPEHHPVSRYKDKRIVGWRDNFVYKLRSGEIVAVYSDETERKQAEEALQKANDELYALSRDLEEKVQERTKELEEKSRRLVEAERLAVLGIMANRVAHELRNSLTVVGGFARRLHDKMPDDDPNKKYLGVIVKEVMVLENKVARIIKIDDGT